MGRSYSIPTSQVILGGSTKTISVPARPYNIYSLVGKTEALLATTVQPNGEQHGARGLLPSFATSDVTRAQRAPLPVQDGAGWGPNEVAHGEALGRCLADKGPSGSGGSCHGRRCRCCWELTHSRQQHESVGLLDDPQGSLLRSPAFGGKTRKSKPPSWSKRGGMSEPEDGAVLRRLSLNSVASTGRATLLRTIRRTESTENLLSISHVPGTRAPGVNKTAEVPGSWHSVLEEDADMAWTTTFSVRHIG